MPDTGYPDRRSAPRYLLSLPVTAHIAPTSEPVSGITRNISVRGVYFTTDLRLTPGSFLDLSMTLPAEYSEGTEVFIRTQGRVVREERESAGRTGVAMVIQKYEIVRNKANLS
jgi:hypothetical protein